MSKWIIQYFNEANLSPQEEDEWPEVRHWLNLIISSKEFPDLSLNEYQQLIKQPQNHCHIIPNVQCCAEIKDSPFVSKYVSYNDESIVTCSPCGGRKMDTSPFFMPKHSALEPVTMTRTGSWKGTLKLPQKKTEWIWGRSPVCHVMPN